MRGAGCKGKSTGRWICTLHDAHDKSVYKGNGLYDWIKDSAGGWNQAESMMTLGDLKMIGECVPWKDCKQTKDALKWRQAELIKKGYKTEIPKCMTFTEFMDHLKDLGLLPRNPDPNFVAGEETVEDPPSSQSHQPQQLHTENNVSVVTAGVTQDSVLVVDSNGQPLNYADLQFAAQGALPGSSSGFQQVQVAYSQLVENEFAPENDSQNNFEQEDDSQNMFAQEDGSQNMYEAQHTEVPGANLALVLMENEKLANEVASLKTENHALKTDNNKILTNNVILEEKLSEGSTGNNENLLASLTGVIDDRINKYANSAEACIKREIHSAFTGSGPVAQLAEKINVTNNTVNNQTNRIVQLTAKMCDVDRTVQTLSQNQAENKESLGTILGISRTVKTKLDTNSGFRNVSLNDSGLGSSFTTPSTKVKSLRKCSFCLEYNHGYETCPQRPTGYKCYRCNGISHREENCRSKEKPCGSCGVEGHHMSLHYLTDPDERCKVMREHGWDNFAHYVSGASPPQPIASSTPMSQGKQRSQGVKRPGGPGGSAPAASSSSTPGQVWLNPPHNVTGSTFKRTKS